MAKQQLPLSSDQLELLLAFEQCDGLGHLAEHMGRDPSVISRSLQRIAEDSPVLAKVSGRWELTPLGRQINSLTRNFIDAQKTILQSKVSAGIEACHSERAMLMIINAQKGILDPCLGARSNDKAEENIGKLLKEWRSARKPILHVKHMSENPASVFYKNSPSSEFLRPLSPMEGERVLAKAKASAFTETGLEGDLRQEQIDTVILVGFTANECVDATARHAADFGFSTYIVGDATAMFDITDTDGKVIKAERIHRVALANLNAICAKVIDTSYLLKS